MFPSNNLVVTIEFLADGYFEVAETTANGTWITGTPIKPGSVSIRATLIGTRDDSGYVTKLKMPLEAVATMEIYQQIDLQPQLSGNNIEYSFLVQKGEKGNMYDWQSYLQPVWPVKCRQMSIMVAQKWFH